MITIKNLNQLIESTGFVTLYRNKPDYFKKVHEFWSKKAARKNAAQYNIEKRDGWARAVTAKKSPNLSWIVKINL